MIGPQPVATARVPPHHSAAPPTFGWEAEALARFWKPTPYATTRKLDELRATEYGRLDADGQVYLDYTGGGLYAAASSSAHMRAAARRRARQPALRQPDLARAPPRSWSGRARTVLRLLQRLARRLPVIFTPNATGALRLVGESYPFGPGGNFLLTVRQPQLGQRHPRVRARERRRRRPTCRSCRPSSASTGPPDGRARAGRAGSAPNLFAFPAQSNFSGVQHPLDWIAEAHEAGWDVLLDAAAFAPTNRLDLAAVHPDFVAVSFYKMFGYPTGVGCLLMRRNRARAPAPAVVLGRHGHHRVGAGRRALSAAPTPGRSRTAPSTTWTSRPSAIGLGTSSASASTPMHDARGVPHVLAARALAGLRTRQRPPLIEIHGPDDGTAAGARSPSTSATRDGRVVDDRRRGTGRQRPHLVAHGLLLQPGRRRGRLLDRRGHAERRPSSTTR